MSHESFQQAIFDEPDDDALRLIYADWLDEHDDPIWAEFIRLQCELATLTPASDRILDLREREIELQALLKGRQVIPEPELDVDRSEVEPSFPFDYHRGFPNSVYFERQYGPTSYELKAIDRLCDAIEMAHPLSAIQRWQFVQFTPDHVAHLLEREVLRHARQLYLSWSDMWATSGSVDAINGIAKQIATSPFLRQLHKLTFWYPVGNAGLEALGNAIALDSLESLQLYVSEVSSDGIAQLAQSPLAKRLRELTLSQEGYLWPESIRGLTSGRWECLHTLSFPNDKIKLAGVGILALSDALPELVSLDLSGNPLGSEGMINLSQSSNLNLRELHLDRASLGREGLWHLTRSDLTNHLRALSLEDNDSPVADVRQLMQSSWFSQLRHLNFHSLTLRDKELTSLAEGDLYQELTKLNWYGSVLDPPCKPSQGAELVKALHLPKIRHLRLAAIPMGTRGAKALAGKEWISSIRMLDLSNCEIGESGAKALLETLCPNQLVHLKLANNDLSSSIEALFDERFPIARLELK